MDLFSFRNLQPRITIVKSLQGFPDQPHQNFIRLLAVAIALEVNILPLTWRPALESLGEGATGLVSQSPLNSQIEFAFKRFNRINSDPDRSEADFRNLQYEAMISEMVTLSCPEIYDHPNIVNLEGLCWEVLPGSDEVWPVLAFRKAEGGDLLHFLSSPDALEFDSDDLLVVCGEVAKALRIMHLCGIVHGDIKPENVLIYKGSEPAVYGVKVTDFGYSCFKSTDENLVLVPRTQPWEAPEWHERFWQLKYAKMMDVYSFGLLCLWLFFREEPLVETDSTGVKFESAFSGQDMLALQTLQTLKKKDVLLDRAVRLVDHKADINEDTRSHLRQIFMLSLSKDTEKRALDMPSFVDLLWGGDLGQLDRVEAYTLAAVPDWHGTLELAKFFFDMEACDFRVQSCFTRQLIATAEGKGCSACVSNAAFQLALCYSFGFGVRSDQEKCRHWLQASGKSTLELDDTLRSLKQMTPSLSSMEAILKLGYQGQLPEEYENERILQQVAAEYRAMVSSRELLFGSAHFSTRRLRGLLSDILYRNGQLEESAQLTWKDVKISEEDEESRGELLVLKSKLARTYEDLGRLDESESLRKEVLDGYSVGPQQDDVGRVVTLFNLTSISLERGNNEEAINRGVVAVTESLRVLGPYHSNTLIAKSTLASAYYRAGRLDQAVDLNLEVAQARERSIGPDHPDTIESLHRLGLLYYSLGKYELALPCYERVMEARIQRLSKTARPAIIAVNNYASTLNQLAQSEKAASMLEELLAEVREALGPDNNLTVTVMSNLSVSYQWLKLYDKAEVLGREVLNNRRSSLGEEHDNTLKAMANLSDSLFDQKKWSEAGSLSLEELGIRESLSDGPDKAKLGAIIKASRSLAYTGTWEKAVHCLEQEVVWREALRQTDDGSQLQALGLVAIGYMKLQRWREARIGIAKFLETFLEQSEKIRISLLDTVHDLAMSCEEENWLEEAEQLTIIQVLMLERSGSANEIMDERKERIVMLMQQQGKVADQIVFDPTAILSRAKGLVEGGVNKE